MTGQTRFRWARQAPKVAAIAALGLLVAACGDDDGGDVRELENGSSESESGSGSGSASGSGSVGSGSEASESEHRKIPDGVIEQYTALEEEIEAEGGDTTSGPWRVGYIVEPAEPWYEKDGDDFTFREPAADETNHVEIIPFEAATGRVVPDVPIQLEIIDADGNVVDSREVNFLYSGFFHYANNFAVPEAGTYTLRATLEAPDFRRHGEAGVDPALAEGAVVEFDGVELGPQS